MNRVAYALAAHELLERSRDRWVLVISVLFALLASAVSLYGKAAESEAGALTGPSLVTLASLLVPLVALVLSHDAIVGERERNTLGMLLALPVGRMAVVIAKFVGRAAALSLAVLVGLGAAIALAAPGEGRVLAALIGPTLLLGLTFLALGMLLSAVVSRQITAASLVVITWFLLVFFYDMGLLGLLVATDGQIGQGVISGLVLVNPAGLYRMSMMEQLGGPEMLEGLGMASTMPGPAVLGALWGAWIALPVVASGALLLGRKALR